MWGGIGAIDQHHGNNILMGQYIQSEKSIEVELLELRTIESPMLHMFDAMEKLCRPLCGHREEHFNGPNQKRDFRRHKMR